MDGPPGGPTVGGSDKLFGVFTAMELIPLLVSSFCTSELESPLCIKTCFFLFPTCSKQPTCSGGLFLSAAQVCKVLSNLLSIFTTHTLSKTVFFSTLKTVELIRTLSTQAHSGSCNASFAAVWSHFCYLLPTGKGHSIQRTSVKQLRQLCQI